MTKTLGNSTIHSSKGTLLSLLDSLNSEDLKEFIHRCADEICGRKGPSKENFVSLGGNSPSQFHDVVNGVQAFLVDCVVQNFDRKKLEEILPLSEGQIDAILSCIITRKDELQKYLLSYYQGGSTEVLRDHDWKLKWVMGSSSLSSLQETLLELDLTTEKRTNSPLQKPLGSQCKRVRVELTRDNVNCFINALEKAQESL